MTYFLSWSFSVILLGLCSFSFAVEMKNHLPDRANPSRAVFLPEETHLGEKIAALSIVSKPSHIIHVGAI